jgi:hypothetical protein
MAALAKSQSSLGLLPDLPRMATLHAFLSLLTIAEALFLRNLYLAPPDLQLLRAAMTSSVSLAKYKSLPDFTLLTFRGATSSSALVNPRL